MYNFESFHTQEAVGSDHWNCVQNQNFQMESTNKYQIELHIVAGVSHSYFT